ncbi:hypothetical protein BDN72DRAFT_147130 [Pluteus cervinus]|uniref:Uncharacterized protein n=1 Tax=Pluteus cervinus TaxID=181527 RepID=A0ACD3AL64_9AGAR|nr:hypothetical protein BDN72DRAFT_147130 [Pluteus cervinus]
MSSKFINYDAILENALELSLDAAAALRKQIDLEIAELNDRLHYLAVARSKLAPVHRLPREILAKIFDLVRVGDNGRVFARRILPVSWVSRQWREAALEDPFLWDHIDRSNCRWAISCLIRSKNVPLVLELSDQATAIISLTTMETLFGELPRIRRLKLGGADSELDSFRGSYGSTEFEVLEYQKAIVSTTNSLALLETLHITGHALTDSFSSSPMPHLASLTLQNAKFKWETFRLSPLRSFCIETPHIKMGVTDLLEYLSQMPFVERITLRGVFSEVPSSEHRVGQLPKINFPKLASLILQDQQVDALMELLNGITFPSQASLTLATSISMVDRPEEALLPFLPIVERRFSATTLSLNVVAISRSSQGRLSFGFGQRESCSVLGETILQTIGPEYGKYSLQALLHVLSRVPVSGARWLHVRRFPGFLSEGDFGAFHEVLGLMPQVKELVLESYFGMELLKYLARSPTVVLPASLKTITYGKLYEPCLSQPLEESDIRNLALRKKNASLKMIAKDPELWLNGGDKGKALEAAFDEVDRDQGTDFLFFPDEF